MPYRYNPFTGKLDDISLDTTTGDLRYLKLDQTTPQTVDNGAPTFAEGIVATATGDTAITANKDIVLKAGRKLIFNGA